MKKNNNFPKRQHSYLTKAIIYGILALLCFYNIKGTWALMLIFLVLTVFYAFEYYKHKNDKSFIEVVKSVLKEDEYDKDGNLIVQKDVKTIKEERKKTFQDYLAQIEKDFDDKELDEAIKNEENNFGEDSEYEDLYIR